MAAYPADQVHTGSKTHHPSGVALLTLGVVFCWTNNSRDVFYEVIDNSQNEYSS
tara:strand:+ start:147 stop:308 length:162 start_codon:yes stop_codon:yes gene_type:complete